MIVLAAVIMAASFGVILPFLFSAASTFLVGVGILYLLIIPVVLMKMYKMTMKMINKETEIENS
jgi:Sec-independent protein secretion pathway component TatC